MSPVWSQPYARRPRLVGDPSPTYAAVTDRVRTEDLAFLPKWARRRPSTSAILISTPGRARPTELGPTMAVEDVTDALDRHAAERFGLPVGLEHGHAEARLERLAQRDRKGCRSRRHVPHGTEVGVAAEALRGACGASRG